MCWTSRIRWQVLATKQNHFPRTGFSCIRQFHYIVLVILFLVFSVSSRGIFHSPSLPEEDLYQPGDINLGALVRLYYPSPEGHCGGELAHVGVQVAQAIRWSVSKINNDSKILPNISIGFILLNDCGREGVALARAMKFLPPSTCLKEGCGKVKPSNTAREPLPFYKVAGVMGPFSSSLSVAVSPMLSLYKVPHVSWSATSEELSNKERFKYFSRAVPPDQFQAAAMIDILKYYNWTYISTIHAEGSYGVNGIRNVYTLAKRAGICVAFSRELRKGDTEEDYDNVVVQLRKHPNARIVVAFTVGYAAEGILKAIRKAKATEFIFIGSDGFQPTLASGQMPVVGLNALVLDVKSSMEEQFKTYYTEELTPWRGKDLNVDSPWYGEYTPDDVGCKWDVSHKNSCSKYKKLTDFSNFFLFPGIARVIDIVETYSRALDSLIKSNCPKAFARKDLLETCISGPKVLDSVRSVSFQGSSSYVSYDEKGDLLGDYTIKQVRGTGERYTTAQVGSWSRMNEQLTLDAKTIVWGEQLLPDSSHYEIKECAVNDEIGTLAIPAVEEVEYKVPESVCAKPCGTGEFYIKGELPCCWDCRRCRSNERLREDVEGCVVCPELHWPDQVNFTTCEPVPPTYMQWLEPIALGLIGLGFAGIISVIGLVHVFIKYSDKKVIKGSSRELMAPIMMGLFIAYLTVFAFVTKPQDWSCYANYFGFNMACTFIFGPLFLKTNRLYRIFQAAEKCKQGVKMVDGKSQVLMFIMLVIIQIVLTAVAATLLPLGARHRMPVSTVRHVELLCNLPMQNLLMPLSFNIFLLFLCGIFGFFTRRLPDNFNESWYIFISVTTTLFVWVAFFPTYFIAFYAYHKAALLALALILNGVVTTVCLFAPKIYAVYYVDEKQIKVTNWGDYEDTINDSVTITTSVGNLESVPSEMETDPAMTSRKTH